MNNKLVKIGENFLEIEKFISEKEKQIKKSGIKISFQKNLNSEELKIIQNITRKEENLELHENEHYLKNAKNGVIFLKRGKKIIGFIFNHKYKFLEENLYERGTLWVDNEERKHGYGKYLMFKMTNLLKGKSIVSVTSNPIVQKINKILMEFEVLNPNGEFKKSLEENGPLCDSYKYFISGKISKIIK